MLELILGTPGTGKTYTILKRLTAATQDASSVGGCLLLVPEQFSFESERRLLRELGAAAASSVKVYSFTRLADVILHEAGDVAGRRMDDSTRTLLVSQALSQTESVRTLTRHGSDSGQVALVAGMLSELKQCALTAADVRAQAERETGRLRDKLTDLSLIAEAYDALIEQTFVDPRDTLTRAADHLQDASIGAGAHIFVDGFNGFTVQEMNLLGGLMQRAAQMTVTLCTDSLQPREDGYNLFAIPTETAHTLMRIARDRGVSVAPAIYLTDDHRYRAASLKALGSELFRMDGQALDEPAPEVTVAACADVYDECEMVTRTIRRILREGGRCRDIAVVARDLAPYRGLLDVSLNRAGIPTFFDVRDDILTDSLCETVLSAIRVVTEGWQTESLLRLLKTGLLGFSAHSISLLEDYVYLWDLSGSGWRRPWTKSTEGFSDRQTDDDTKLYYLNILRHRLIEPLERLHRKLKEPLTARDFSLAVIEYLQNVSAARLTRLRVRQFDAMGETVLADRTARLWDVMMDLVSVFGEVGPASPCPARELSRLLQMVAGEIRLGSIPQSLDAVQIGAADRIRMSAPKVVFVLGANEGVFPGTPSASGYFTQRERRRLLDQQMPLTPGAEWQINQEQLFAYAAVTAPSERLYVSYVTGDLSGETRLPSSLVYAIESVLPQCAKQSEHTPDGADAETPEEAMNRYTESYRHPTRVSATLSAALCRQSGYAEKMDALRRCAERLPWQIHDAETARRLFGDRMKISYTAVDTYYECPFRYFCRYGLRVSPLRRAELNALEFGVAVHYLMEHVLPLYIKQGIGTVTREQTRQDASDFVDRYVAEQMGGVEDMPARFVYLVTRLKVLAQRLLWFVVQEQRQSRFTPADYELVIDETDDENAVRPLTLSLPDGTQISVTGKIDRVDTYQEGGKTYLRVLDYKTGSKAFELDEVVEGLNLQMFIYLFTLCHRGTARYGGAEPAGVLYLPATMPVVEADKGGKSKKESDSAGASDEGLERKQLRKMRMNGLLIDDPTVLEAMEADGGGSFIPAYRTRGGSTDSVATLWQFGRLKRRMEELLLQMAQTLRAGKIDALPFENKNRTACNYCDYRDVCGFEDGDPKRTVTLGLREQIMGETADEPASPDA